MEMEGGVENQPRAVGLFLIFQHFGSLSMSNTHQVVKVKFQVGPLPYIYSSVSMRCTVTN